MTSPVAAAEGTGHAHGYHRNPAATSVGSRRGRVTGAGAPTTAARAPACRWTPERIRALGVVTDLVTAAGILGLSRNTAYALARDGRFPVPVLRAGRLYRVSVPALLAALGLDSDPTGPGWT